MDVEKLADSVLKAVEGRIAKALEPLVARLDAIESKEIPSASSIVAAVLAGDGLKTLVDLQVAESVAQIEIPVPETPEPGKKGDQGDAGVGIADALIDREGSLVLTLTNGETKTLGKVVGEAVVTAPEEAVASAVKSYMDANPIKSEPGAPGVGLAGAMIDREGALCVTLSNGEVKNLGPVVGKDGQDGDDGQDGLGFDDLSVSFDGESIVHAYKRGDKSFTHTFPLNVMKHIGFWREGMEAKSGQTTTRNGSLWICLTDTQEDPNYQAKDWILAARAGRDGLDKTDAKPSEPVKLHGN